MDKATTRQHIADALTILGNLGIFRTTEHHGDASKCPTPIQADSGPRCPGHPVDPMTMLPEGPSLVRVIERLQQALSALDHQHWIDSTTLVTELKAKLFTIEAMGRDRDDVEVRGSWSNAAQTRSIDNYRTLCDNIATVAREGLTILGEPTQ